MLDRKPKAGSLESEVQTSAVRRPKSIQTLLSRRPRLPPPMHPQPLLRILPYILFNNRCELLRIGLDVGLELAGSHQLHSRIEAQPILSQLRIPDRETGNHGGIGP